MGGPGGSGGGNSYQVSGVIASGFNYPGPTQQGFPGADGGPAPVRGSAGGGGAGAAGNVTTAPPTVFGSGGIGKVAFSGDTGIPASYGTSGPTAGRWFAGGGGAGGYPTGVVGGSGGDGGGGAGGAGAPSDPPISAGTPGTQYTGGGAGGAGAPGTGGTGGDGIVIIRVPFI